MTQISAEPNPTQLPAEVTVTVVREPVTVEDGIGTVYRQVSDDGQTAVFKGTVEPIHGDFLTITASDGTETTLKVEHPIVVKDRTLGMCDRGGHPNPAGASVVVHVPLWQIAPDTHTLNMAPLIKAISAAKAAGASGCVLSLDGGMAESVDAKKVFGSVHLTDPQGVRPAFDTVAFWTPAYQQYAKSVNDSVALVIEDDPFVREMMMWWNGTEFSPEWPIRNASTQVNRDAYVKAKYDVLQDVKNILAAPEMFAASFKKTLMTTWMPMGFQRMTATSVKQDFTVNVGYLDQVVLHTPNAILGVDNADLKSYGPNRPQVYQLALDYHRAGLRRRDQTVIADKMQGGPAGVATFFGQANLALAIADGVYAIEYPRGSTMTQAQFVNAHKQLLAGAAAAGE